MVKLSVRTPGSALLRAFGKLPCHIYPKSVELPGKGPRRNPPQGIISSLYIKNLTLWSSALKLLKIAEKFEKFFNSFETWVNSFETWVNLVLPCKTWCFECECAFFSFVSHQALHQKQFTLHGTPLTFNFTSRFEWVIFDCALPLVPKSFNFKFYLLHRALHLIALNRLIGTSPMNHSIFNIKHSSVPSSCMPLQGGSSFRLFSAIGWRKNWKVFHKSACRTITGCISLQLRQTL